MPSTAKSGKSGSSPKKTSGSSQARATSSRNRSSSAKRSPSTASSRRQAQANAPSGDGIGDTVGSIGSKARSGAATVAKGAAAATVGTVVAAVAGRALIASRRRKRVLGVPMPRKHRNMKSVAKQVAGLAGQLEQKSADVSKASGRAKQAAKVLA